MRKRELFLDWWGFKVVSGCSDIFLFRFPPSISAQRVDCHRTNYFVIAPGAPPRKESAVQVYMRIHPYVTNKVDITRARVERITRSFGRRNNHCVTKTNGVGNRGNMQFDIQRSLNGPIIMRILQQAESHQGDSTVAETLTLTQTTVHNFCSRVAPKLVHSMMIRLQPKTSCTPRG